MTDHAIITETGHEPRLEPDGSAPVGSLARGVNGALYVLGYENKGNRAWIRIAGTGERNRARFLAAGVSLAGYAVRLVSAEVERIP